MGGPDEEQDEDDVVVLPPVPVDPVFAEAVEDALAGDPAQVLASDPYRLLGADPHDFAGLYIRHRSSFALHARRFLRDQRDVDEVVQEAFLRLFLALPELESELQALSYCRRTVTNLCIDRYRADQRRPRLVDLESLPPESLLDDLPDDPVVQAEDAAVVRHALALLTPLHRQALVKREIEEKPLPVIAAELSVAEDSVKHLLHRARRALRRHLAETHLAPGADLESTSSLRQLVRAGGSASSRLGVLVLLVGGLALGATSRTPVQTLGALWGEDPSPGTSAQGGPAAAPGVGSLPEGVFGADRDFPGPVVAPVVPAALPGVPTAVRALEEPSPASSTVRTAARARADVRAAGSTSTGSAARTDTAGRAGQGTPAPSPVGQDDPPGDEPAPEVAAAPGVATGSDGTDGAAAAASPVGDVPGPADATGPPSPSAPRPTPAGLPGAGLADPPSPAASPGPQDASAAPPPPTDPWPDGEGTGVLPDSTSAAPTDRVVVAPPDQPGEDLPVPPGT